jgi:hypothetical protein
MIPENHREQAASKPQQEKQSRHIPSLMLYSISIAASILALWILVTTLHIT